MPFQIVRNDLTKMKLDAIVNAANTELKAGGGVCGAIFKAAGSDRLQAACNAIGRCEVGEAVITDGFALPAKYIIHTPGPVWHGGNDGEAEKLYNCYHNSLMLAQKYKCKTIGFPLISSGIYGYPKDQALSVAMSAIGDFLMQHDMTIYLVVFDKTAVTLSEKLFTAIESYIDDNYVDEMHVREGNRTIGNQLRRSEIRDVDFSKAAYGLPMKKQRSLEDLVEQLDDSFSQMVLRLIDEKGMTDVETYKRANMDRRLFSKIRSGAAYQPKKSTSIALAIALRLNLDETKDLLARAGYTLSSSSKFDVIIEYFINEGNYNIFEINEALFAFDQMPLGA
jgi:O-acetyl-ADP-ribose deacetylase (regulator of RNase III)